MSGKKIILTVIALALIVVSLFAYGQKVLAYNVVIGGEVVGQLKDAEVLEEAIADFKSKKENEIGQVVNEAVNIELQRAQIDEKLLVKDVNELVEKKWYLLQRHFLWLLMVNLFFLCYIKKTWRIYLNNIKLNFLHP
jgi:maltodextrin utilization protein YvdJ